MMSCINKRKRGFENIPLSTEKSANDSTSSKNVSGAIRIGCDSPRNDEIPNWHTNVCSIRDDHEPTCRQSSLLSFFTKEKRVKSQQNAKDANDKLSNRSGTRCVKTPLQPPSSSHSGHRTTKIPSIERAVNTSLMRQPESTLKSKKRKLKSLTQVYIDFGQSKFGQILCNKCGMLYMPGILEDENEHKLLCQAYSLGIPCNRGNVKGGKQVDFTNENDGSSNDEATIVSWRPCVKAQSSSKSKEQQTKAENCRNGSNNKDRPSQWPLLARMISKDLGTHEETTLDHLTNETVFLYIRKIGKTASGAYITDDNRHRIIAVATVQLLGQVQAYRMISLYERSLIPATEAKLGIGLLWTHLVARNSGIATKLVHAAREHAIFGMRVARQDVAFSNPTQAGYIFASRYCNGERKNGIDIATDNIARINDHQGCNPEINSNTPEKKSLCSGSIGPLVYEMNL